MNELQVNSIIVASYNIKNYSDIILLIEKLESRSYSNIRIFLVIEGPAYLFAELRNYIQRSNLRQINIIFNNVESELSSGAEGKIEIWRGDMATTSNGDNVYYRDWLN